jgi:hypothetical protein
MRIIPNKHIICDRLFEVYMCLLYNLNQKNCEQCKFNNNYAIIISVEYMEDRLNNGHLYVAVVPELHVCVPLLSPAAPAEF